MEPGLAGSVGDDRQRRLFRVAPVFLHDLWRLDENLADLLDRHLVRRVFGLDDLHDHVGHGDAHRSGLPFTAERIRRGGDERLGERVGLDDASASDGLESLLGLGHQRRGTGRARLERMEMGLSALHLRVVEQGVVERGHATERRRLHPGHGVHDIVKVAGIGDEGDRVAVDDRRRLHRAGAVGMKEREGEHVGVGPLGHHGLGPGAELQSGGHQPAVWARHGLGGAGGAAAQEKHRDLAR